MASIVCSNMVKEYGTVKALDGLSFSMDGKGCVGFLGPNGAGKTTTIRILVGLCRPTSGEAQVDGFNVLTHRNEFRSRIGYLAQTPAFYNYMSGEEFMLWTGDLFGMGRKEARLRTEELLRQLGLWDARRRAIGGYSGGMRQRMGIAQALINRPRILFLDEPVSALDPIGRYEILNLIEQLKDQTTVFMSTHVLADVERVCDHVIIVREGKVAVQASLGDLRERYATPVFTVETDPHDPDLTDRLQGHPYVQGVRRDGATYRVSVSDVASARSRLPADVLEAGATLVRYGSEAPALEDIFLKVVNGK